MKVGGERHVCCLYTARSFSKELYSMMKRMGNTQKAFRTDRCVKYALAVGVLGRTQSR